MKRSNSDLSSTFICPRCDKALHVQEEADTKEVKNKEQCELCKQQLARVSQPVDR
ncbi:MAG: hypothetical protein H7X79_09345 [Sporomusaceae bacterium]|nr:hypothetical protein [Sporomusaceae bacterium]